MVEEGSAPFRLSILSSRPQQKPIQLDDGTTVMGYAKGTRTLRSIEAAFLDAWQAGHNEDGTRKSSKAFQDSLTQMIMAVVPNLTYFDADSMSDGEVMELLEYLGWWSRTSEGEDEDPPVQAPTMDTLLQQ
jgi:hypothetical protein